MNLGLHFFLEKLRTMERSPHRLALSCCAGIFVALSPFLGIQTILALGVSYLFHLNTPVVILILYLINNPFTMVPIAIAGYTVGLFICERMLHISLSSFSPAWVQTINAYFSNKLATIAPQMQFSMEYYLFGGLVLALMGAVVAYPLCYYCCTRLQKRP